MIEMNFFDNGPCKLVFAAEFIAPKKTASNN